MSGFRDDLGASRERQERLARENEELRAELEKQRKEHADALEAAKRPPPAPSTPKAAPFVAAGAAVLLMAATGFVLLARSSPPQEVSVPAPPKSVQAPRVPAPEPPPKDAWQPVPLPEKASLHAIDGALDVLYAVGDGGAIFRKHKTKVEWTRETSATDADLLGVTVLGGTVVAVGEGGVIVGLPSQKETAFTAVRSPTKKTLRAVSATGLGTLAVGDEGTVVEAIFWPSTPFAARKSPTKATLHAVCGENQEAWIAGDGGTLLHLDRSTVEVVASGTTEDLYGIHCHGDVIVAVGAHGVVVRRSDPREPFQATHEGTSDLLFVESRWGNSPWIAGGRGAHLGSASGPMPSTGLSGDLEGLVESTQGTFAVGPGGLFVRVN